MHFRRGIGWHFPDQVKPVHLQPTGSAEYLVRIETIGDMDQIHDASCLDFVAAAAARAGAGEREGGLRAGMHVDCFKLRRGLRGLPKTYPASEIEQAGG